MSQPAGASSRKRPPILAQEWQVRILRTLFEQTSRPTSQQKSQASVDTGLPEEWIGNWFARQRRSRRPCSSASNTHPPKKRTCLKFNTSDAPTFETLHRNTFGLDGAKFAPEKASVPISQPGYLQSFRAQMRAPSTSIQSPRERDISSFQTSFSVTLPASVSQDLVPQNPQISQRDYSCHPVSETNQLAGFHSVFHSGARDHTKEYRPSKSLGTQNKSGASADAIAAEVSFCNIPSNSSPSNLGDTCVKFGTTDFFSPSFPTEVFPELVRSGEPRISLHKTNPIPFLQPLLAQSPQAATSTDSHASLQMEATAAAPKISASNQASPQAHPRQACSGSLPVVSVSELPEMLALLRASHGEQGHTHPLPLFCTARIGDLQALLKKSWGRVPSVEEPNELVEGAVSADQCKQVVNVNEYARDHTTDSGEDHKGTNASNIIVREEVALAQRTKTGLVDRVAGSNKENIHATIISTPAKLTCNTSTPLSASILHNVPHPFRILKPTRKQI